MPYKRYDITNTYSYRGRKKNDKVVLKAVFLVLLPLLIATLVVGGVYLAYLNSVSSDNSSDILPVSSVDEEQVNLELTRVVNDRHQLDADYEPALVDYNGIKVNSLIVRDLQAMVSDAEKDGVNLDVIKGYVSYLEQEELYNVTYDKIKTEQKLTQIKAEAETKKVCPVAGSSESQTGLLITFDSNEENYEASKQHIWLTNHSVNYGFILRYPEDSEGETGMSYNPYIYRYVGKESARNIRRYDMTLEEYSRHISVR